MAKADVIAAIATAAGRAAVGIVRISGPDLRPLFTPLLGRKLRPRVAALSDLLAGDGVAIDRGLAIYFAGPHSYTGEDVLELQAHGGPVVLRRLLRRCLELGARAAEPGEFTRRAFLNDKLDLAQAESVADLIEASSEVAARAAMRSLRGEFSQQIHALVRGLVDLRVLVEALLDFPEEEIERPQRQEIEERLKTLVSRLGSIQRAARSGALLREGSIVVLIGRPNVGKSSLLNRLAGEELAIVTEIPGTTRDTIRQELLLEGVPIHVVDTAGLRESVDRIEQLGMARTRDIIQRADVAVVVVDTRDGLVEDDEAVLKEVPAKVPRVIVFNKIDLLGEKPQVSKTERGSEVRVSARTGAGMELLRHQILAAVGWQPLEEGVFLARERHLLALQRAAEHLDRASEVLEAVELIAEELRLAQERLVELTGGFTADDLLGEIFSRFCIGK